jgi:hypothetical protein
LNLRQLAGAGRRLVDGNLTVGAAIERADREVGGRGRVAPAWPTPIEEGSPATSPSPLVDIWVVRQAPVRAEVVSL